MKTNEELKKDVQDSLKWEPLLQASEIEVSVKDGIVTLNGNVNNFAKKFQAEEVAKYVAGVIAVVENMVVKFESIYNKTDDEIAAEIMSAFRWHWDIPNEKITIKVQDGWVSLEGDIEWNYQKQAAKNALINLIGVKGISNNIAVISKSKDAINIKNIKDALWRHVTIDHDGIKVTVSGRKVTLTGIVESWYQKEEASKVVWNAPGVLELDNQLTIQSIT